LANIKPVFGVPVNRENGRKNETQIIPRAASKRSQMVEIRYNRAVFLTTHVPRSRYSPRTV